jgi:uncharacterized protein HemX
MKGYRQKAGARFHMEHDPVVAALERRVHCISGTVLAVAAVVIAAAGTAYTVYSTEQAAAEQKKIAKANAARIQAENDEALRRLKKQQAATMAEARARAAASGVTVEGTQKSYLEEMKEAFKSETDWLRDSGASRAYITQREGTLKAQTTSAQGISSAFSGASSAFSAGASYYGTS